MPLLSKGGVRIRKPDEVIEIAGRALAATGYSEVSLVSLSSGDYPFIEELMEAISNRFARGMVNISLPSLRVSEKLAKIPALLARVRKSGLTLAPEAATLALREAIGKPITDEQLAESALCAFGEGWDLVKLYFMIGLPGEKDADVEGIVDLSERISGLRKRISKGKAKVNVSVSTLIPKPHTPFERRPMSTGDEIERKQMLILDRKKNYRVRYKFNDYKLSFIEAAMSIGDRRLGKVILEAYRRGARFDAWKDEFDFEIWQAALRETGVDAERLVFGERSGGDAQPWDHIKLPCTWKKGE